MLNALTLGLHFIFLLGFFPSLWGDSFQKPLLLKVQEEEIAASIHFLGYQDKAIILEINGKKPFYKLKPSQSYFISPQLHPTTEEEASTVFKASFSWLPDDKLQLNLCRNDSFNIEPKEFKITLNKNHKRLEQLEAHWQIGEHRVSPQLLWKQQFKWEGQDLLLQKHSQTPHKQEVFVQGGKAIFALNTQNSLYWNEKSWTTKPTEDSCLTLENISSNQVKLHLQDANRLFSIYYSLEKSPSEWYPYKEIEGFTFLKQKEKDAFKVAWGKNILLLRKKDWLICQEGGNIIAVDSKNRLQKLLRYQMEGTLMIVNGMVNQHLELELYNQSRTKAYKVKLPLVPQGIKSYEHYPLVEELN